MQLVYITHQSITNLQAFPPVLSWILVIGGLYGALRLVLDAIRLLGTFLGTFTWSGRR